MQRGILNIWSPASWEQKNSEFCARTPRRTRIWLGARLDAILKTD